MRMEKMWKVLYPTLAVGQFKHLDVFDHLEYWGYH